MGGGKKFAGAIRNVYVDAGSISKRNRPAASVLLSRREDAPAKGPESSGNPIKVTRRTG